MRSILHKEVQAKVVLHRQQKLPPLESDFYNSPTLLSRLVLHEKYSSAIARLQTDDGQRESKTWCCYRRENSPESLYDIHQLPIHVACRQLSHTSSGKDRDSLELLLLHLAVTFPEGCAQSDHLRNYPLHYAVQYRAGPNTLSAILMAAPHVLQITDPSGRSPLEILYHYHTQNSTYLEQVKGLLNRPIEHWLLARDEFRFRSKHRNIPMSETDTITSTSVLAASTVMSHPKPQNDKIAITTWEQMERKYILLERKLADALQDNYRLQSQLNSNHVRPKVDPAAPSKDVPTKRYVNVRVDNWTRQQTGSNGDCGSKSQDYSSWYQASYNDDLDTVLYQMHDKDGESCNQEAASTEVSSFLEDDEGFDQDDTFTILWEEAAQRYGVDRVNDSSTKP